MADSQADSLQAIIIQFSKFSRGAQDSQPSYLSTSDAFTLREDIGAQPRRPQFLPLAHAQQKLTSTSGIPQSNGGLAQRGRVHCEELRFRESDLARVLNLPNIPAGDLIIRVRSPVQILALTTSSVKFLNGDPKPTLPFSFSGRASVSPL